MPLKAKLSLFAYVVSGERSANRPKKLRNDAFKVKTSQSAKNQLDPAKNENRPKFDIRPFCTKPFNLYEYIDRLNYREYKSQLIIQIILEKATAAFKLKKHDI